MVHVARLEHFNLKTGPTFKHFTKLSNILCNNQTKKFDTDVKLYFKDLKILRKKLTTVSITDDSLYFSDDDSVTSPAHDFLEVKTKIITKIEDHSMILLYTSENSNFTTDVSKIISHSESYGTLLSR